LSASAVRTLSLPSQGRPADNQGVIRRLGWWRSFEINNIGGMPRAGTLTSQAISAYLTGAARHKPVLKQIGDVIGLYEWPDELLQQPEGK
jgi:hypothetical protein